MGIAWQREHALAAFAVGAAWAYLAGGRSSGVRSAIGYLSLAGLGREGYLWVQERRLFTAPERMNEHFKSDGRRSAISGVYL